MKIEIIIFCITENLQLYISLGMVVTRIYAGIIFDQAPVIKKYIDFNSEQRAKAVNKFDVDFYKLLSNSLYGKNHRES